MEKIIWIAVAGALGSVARYGVATYVQNRTESAFPYGVFAANMIGSFLFGFLWAYSEDHGWVSEQMRAFAFAGFLGAFTTFSTFAFDNANLAKASSWNYFTLNIVPTNVVGIALALAGLKAGKLV